MNKTLLMICLTVLIIVGVFIGFGHLLRDVERVEEDPLATQSAAAFKQTLSEAESWQCDCQNPEIGVGVQGKEFLSQGYYFSLESCASSSSVVVEFNSEGLAAQLPYSCAFLTPLFNTTPVVNSENGLGLGVMVDQCRSFSNLMLSSLGLSCSNLVTATLPPKNALVSMVAVQLSTQINGALAAFTTSSSVDVRFIDLTNASIVAEEGFGWDLAQVVAQNAKRLLRNATNGEQYVSNGVSDDVYSMLNAASLPPIKLHTKYAAVIQECRPGPCVIVGPASPLYIFQRAVSTLGGALAVSRITIDLLDFILSRFASLPSSSPSLISHPTEIDHDQQTINPIATSQIELK